MASREREKKIYIRDEEERFRRKANVPARLLRFFRHASFRVKESNKGVVKVVEMCCGTNECNDDSKEKGRKKKHIFCTGNVFRVLYETLNSARERKKTSGIRHKKTRCCALKVSSSSSWEEDTCRPTCDERRRRRQKQQQHHHHHLLKKRRRP